MNNPFQKACEVIIEAEAWEQQLPDVVGICENAASAALSATEAVTVFPDLYMSILLSDDNDLKTLNSRFRGVEKPTNVLAFPIQDGIAVDNIAEMLEEDDPFLGDIGISIETVVREAEEQGKTLKDHVTHLVVHAVLHLLGYDHIDEQDRQEMEALEIKILQTLKVENPYII